MKRILSLSAIVLLVVVGGAASPPSSNVFESGTRLTPKNRLDQLVVSKMSALGTRPMVCSDAVFVRRVYLDLLGTLPTATEARDFIRDQKRNKRRALIDQLLERDEFADYWAMKWGDVLRIKAEFPVNLWPNAAQAYHRWVRASIADNKPYDKFARELLTSSGSNFRVGPVNFYRAVQNRTPEAIASAVALTFMGTRTDAWPKDRLAGMAVFFSQIGYKPTREWKEEDVFWDPLGLSAAKNDAAGTKTTAPAPNVNAPQDAVFPDGTKIAMSPNRDPREVFADWLISPENPWFARSVVNRLWTWLLGRGIIHEPDDIRDDNPPVNPELLSYLGKELVASHYDLKRIYRLILNSATYQSSCMPRMRTGQDDKFQGYMIRRLDAEVLIDAINKVTGTTDLYTSAIPEPFTYIPSDQPAVALPDGSITSPFLALFGRSARATGMDNERNNKLMPAQWLHMLNSSHIQRKLETSPKLKAIIESNRKPEQIAEELYLTILSRFPTEEELAAIEAYNVPMPARQFARPGMPNRPRPPKRRDDWLDISWALVNSTEFLFRH